MGPVAVPTTGYTYLDTQTIIYSVERHPVYYPLLRPLWASVQSGSLVAVTSDLTMMEALVGPMRLSDATLESQYDRFFERTALDLVPMTRPRLRRAARLRADHPSLRTPDAIHATSALLSACATIVTNDTAFRQVPGITTILLDDLKS